MIERARPVRVLSQTDVVRYLRINTDKIDAEVLHTPVGRLDIPKHVFSVSPRKSAISAYWHLLRHDVSAVGTCCLQSQFGPLLGEDNHWLALFSCGRRERQAGRHPVGLRLTRFVIRWRVVSIEKNETNL